MSRQNVFLSYSHKDRRACSELLTHLAPLRAQDRLVVWSDQEIATGDKWAAEIDRALSEARIAIMLVSPAFLESRFVTEVEIPRLLSAAKTSGVTVVCVYLEYSVVEQVVFSGVKLTDFQGANSPDRPLAELGRSERGKALRDVALTVLRETTRSNDPRDTIERPTAPTSFLVAEPDRAKGQTRLGRLADRIIPSRRGIESYQILGQIASGPNGEVFKCRAPRTGALCVVKRTEAEKVDLRAQEHLASLSLPNIATPARIWTEGEFVCEELPYIGGTRLSEAVHSSVGGIRGSLLTGFFSQMQRALGALHAANLVHRDVHPDNIYLSVSEADAEPTAAERASDWQSHEIGLSRAHREANPHFKSAAPSRRIVFVLVDCTFATHDGGVEAVTPVMHDSFTPLEQVLGRPSAASDFYAFGATLFYLITGAEIPAYRDRTTDAIRLHPVDARTGRTFDGVLESLLARDPAARRLEMSGSRSTIAPGDCGTMALSDGDFLIANSSDAYSRVVQRGEALEIHNKDAARSKAWLDSHQSFRDSTDDYSRRQYESSERKYAEHMYWIRTLSSFK